MLQDGHDVGIIVMWDYSDVGIIVAIIWKLKG